MSRSGGSYASRSANKQASSAPEFAEQKTLPAASRRGHNVPQCAGNQAMQRALRSGAIRAKLAINQPGDVYEQEADRIANHVMRIPAPHTQRRCACGGIAGPDGECEACQQRWLGIHRQAMSSAPGSGIPDSIHEVIASPGQPLDPAERTFFEQRFGADLSAVRIHTGEQAAESARAIAASAYTHNNHVVFGREQYQPETWAGKTLLAHELVHAIQQGGAQQHRGMSPRVSLQGQAQIQRRWEDYSERPTAPRTNS